MCGVTVNTYTGTVGGAAPLIRSHLYKLHDFSMHHWHNLGFEVNLDHFKSLLSVLPFIQIVVVKIHDLRTTENKKKEKKSYLFSGKSALTRILLLPLPIQSRIPVSVQQLLLYCSTFVLRPCGCCCLWASPLSIILISFLLVSFFTVADV